MDGKEWLRLNDLHGLYCECVKDLPEEFKTAEVYEYAVMENGYALEFVPKEFITTELCMAAVRNRGTAIMYVPEALKTAELCREAVNNSSCWGPAFVLEHIPENIKQPPKRARRARWTEWKNIVYSKVKMILMRCKN